MHKLIATSILIMALPVVYADESTVIPSDAFNICIRATERFEQQEKDNANKKAPITSLSASCKTELKPAAYWLCMDKQAIEHVDFNTAHSQCAKQTKLLK